MSAHMDWHGIEPGPCGERPATDLSLNYVYNKVRDKDSACDGYHNDVAERARLLGCDAVSGGEWVVV